MIPPGMLSPRAQRYLEQLERRPHVEDLAEVRAALEEAGVPATDALLDFHERYAGYVQGGPDVFVWGLVHAAPQWVAAMAVEEIEENGLHYVTCADGHPSYALALDQHGVHYTTACVPRATRFDVMTEQKALVHERVSAASQRGPVAYRRLELCNDRAELREGLLPRLAGAEIAEACDRYGNVYATDELVLEHYVEFDFYAVHVFDGARPAVLRALRWDRDEPRTFEQLRADLLSKYAGRRYQAIYDLRETTDPAAGELFRLVLHDENEQTRRYAIHGLGRVRCREALPELLALIDERTDHGIVNFAINAVLAIDGGAAQDALIRGTRHADRYVRRNAVIALASVGDLEAIPALEALLGDAAVPMAGLRGDKLQISDSAQAAIDEIRKRSGG